MIILVGASASGKTEIAKKLADKYGIVKAITHTSRSPRDGERNGVDYFFVTISEFEELKEKDGFVETTFYNGRYYGCSKAQVADDKAVIVDPNGLKSFLALNDPHVIAFYLECPENIREMRMRGRGDKNEDIAKRIENDREAFKEERIAKVDFRINTENRSVEELTDLVYRNYVEELKKR